MQFQTSVTKYCFTWYSRPIFRRFPLNYGVGGKYKHILFPWKSVYFCPSFCTMHLTIGKVKLWGYKYFLLVKFIIHVNDPIIASKQDWCWPWSVVGCKGAAVMVWNELGVLLLLARSNHMYQVVYQMGHLSTSDETRTRLNFGNGILHRQASRLLVQDGFFGRWVMSQNVHFVWVWATVTLAILAASK